MLQEIFEVFLRMKKGEKIEDPHKPIASNIVISDLTVKIIGVTSNNVFFTRLSLKHLAEKGKEGKRLLELIPFILEKPDTIRKSKKYDSRFLVSKTFSGTKKNRPHIVNLEVTKMNRTIIVTAFQSEAFYLQNFELLWRTAGDDLNIPFPPSQQPSKTTGGSSRLSALKEAQNSRNKSQ